MCETKTQREMTAEKLEIINLVRFSLEGACFLKFINLKKLINFHEKQLLVTKPSVKFSKVILVRFVIIKFCIARIYMKNGEIKVFKGNAMKTNNVFAS